MLNVNGVNKAISRLLEDFEMLMQFNILKVKHKLDSAALLCRSLLFLDVITLRHLQMSKLYLLTLPVLLLISTHSKNHQHLHMHP